jgi:hypothetical protein
MVKKLPKLKSDILNRKIMLKAMNGIAEPYCPPSYSFNMPKVTFLFTRKLKGRYAKYESVAMRFGSLMNTYHGNLNYQHFDNLWCAN